MPDWQDCADLNAQGVDEGYCRNYQSKKKTTYNKKNPYKSAVTKKTYESWNAVPKICQPIDEFLKRKNFLDNYCHQNSSACKGGDVGGWNEVGNDLASKVQERIFGK